MNIRDAGCCAVQEITGLAGTKGDARAAMQEFCTDALRERWYGTSKLYSFYIFTAVVSYKRSCQDATPDEKKNTKYGPNFRKFILENKLGKVTRTTGEYNRINHPAHKVVVYVWKPDEKALKAWWKVNKGVR